MRRRAVVPGLAPVVVLILIAALAPAPARAATIAWADPASGDWLDPNSWVGGVVPATADEALFDEAATYTVSFSGPPSAAGKLTQVDGDVTLDLGGFTHALTNGVSASDPALRIGTLGGLTPELTLTNGTLETEFASLALGSANRTGTLTVSTGGFLDVVLGDLTVGLVGRGTLVTENGGSVEVARDMIVASNVVSPGDVTVTSGSSLTVAEDLLVSLAGLATLLVEGGSSVSAGSLFIGFQQTGLGGTVQLVDPNSLLSTGVLQLRKGSLSVASGATLSTSGATTVLGNTDGLTVGPGGTWLATGITVSGPSQFDVHAGGAIANASAASVGSQVQATVEGSWTNAGNLNVVGTLVVANGGDLTSNGGSLDSSTGIGNAVVDDPGSSWINSGDLTGIGNSPGNLTVSNGAFVSNGSASVKTASVSGDATWSSSGDLTVSSSLAVASGGDVSNAGATLALGATATVSGAGSSWTSSGFLSADGSITATGGATFTSAGASLAPDPDAEVTVSIGAGSSWDNAGALYVGGGASSNGGTAALTAAPGGSWNATGPLVLWTDGSGTVGAFAVTPSEVSLRGGTLAVQPGGVVDTGAFDWQSGTLALSGGTVVAPRVSVPARTDLVGSGAFGAEVLLPESSTVTANGDLALGDAASFSGVLLGGALDAGAHTLTLRDADFARLGYLTEIGGGTLRAANGVALGSGSSLAGSGSVEGRVASDFGSTITALGTLSLGDPNAFDGYFSDGALAVREHTVTLRDRNEAVLGSLTELGSGAGGGTLEAVNGVLLNPGKNLAGHGFVTADFVNEGDVIGAGPDPNDALEFTGDVSGSGDYAGNVTFSGTFSPGSSPGEVGLESFALSASAILQIELGGTEPGSEFDLIAASGAAKLGGALVVSLIDGFEPGEGDAFAFLVAAALSGDFASTAFPVFGDGLTLGLERTQTGLTLTVLPLPEPGSLTLLALGAAGLLALRRRRHAVG